MNMPSIGASDLSFAMAVAWLQTVSTEWETDMDGVKVRVRSWIGGWSGECGCDYGHVEYD